MPYIHSDLLYMYYKGKFSIMYIFTALVSLIQQSHTSSGSAFVFTALSLLFLGATFSITSGDSIN